MPYSFGSVILVPFPFTDQTISKKRPAVVISSQGYNDARADIIVMAITSQLRATIGGYDLALDLWQEAGLLKPSAVKPVIATLEQSLVDRVLGTLATSDQAGLREKISDILG